MIDPLAPNLQVLGEGNWYVFTSYHRGTAHSQASDTSPSVGPHPTAMFEVNTFTPHQTGALFSWLVVNRGPCS